MVSKKTVHITVLDNGERKVYLECEQIEKPGTS